MVDGIRKLDASEQTDLLADEYIKLLSLPQRSIRDSYHLALAVEYEIDILLTWNCRHLANADIVLQINRFNMKHGLHSPIICTPEELFPVNMEE